MAELWQMIEKFSNMPIRELEDIVNNKSDEYEEEAFRTAKRILKERGVEGDKPKPKIKIEDSTREVHLTGFNIPFEDMVGFIFKWTLASIPTALFFGLIIFILSWITNK